MSKDRKAAKTLIIADDDDVNPFSFREFLRSKNQDQNTDSDPDQEQEQDQDQEQEQEQTHSEVEGGQSGCSAAWTEVDESGGLSPDADRHAGDHDAPVTEGATHIQQLQQENLTLRRTIRQLQRRAEADKSRMAALSQELQQRRQQEEQEARQLESMVHSVESNLGRMTKRALKAESGVAELRLQLQQLQSQAAALRRENQRLRSSESELVVTMRSNAMAASQHLHKTASRARLSISQLTAEADSLRLAAELLRSIDKISESRSESESE